MINQYLNEVYDNIDSYRTTDGTVDDESNKILIEGIMKFKSGKGKKAYHSFEDRKTILEAIRYVDEVLPEYTWEQKIDDVVNNQVDVFVMGDDWTGKFDFLKDYCEVVYLPRTEGISTSKIKEDLGLGKSEA